MTVSPPPIGDPPKRPEDPYKPTRKEVRDFIKSKYGVTPNKLPISKRARIRRKVRNKLRRKKKRESIPTGTDISFTQGDAPWQVIYGETIVSGVITFAHTTNKKSVLHLVITLACHEIHEVVELYLDGFKIIFGGSPDPRWATSGVQMLDESVTVPAYMDRVFMAVNNGAPGNPAIADLVAAVPTHWTANHLQAGRAQAYLQLHYNGRAFPDGEPDVSFRIRGKPVYDPRTLTTAYSNNAALCLADYLTEPTWGRKQPLSALDNSSLVAAANVCDEAASYYDENSVLQHEQRYTVNGSFTLDTSPEEIIDELGMAMAGQAKEFGNIWYFFPGKWRSPVLQLTENDLRGDPQLETIVSRQDRFNAVKGTFPDVNAFYESTDYTNEAIASYVAADGGEVAFQDINLPFTRSVHTARRIARIELERIRREVTLKAEWSLKALKLIPGDNIQITLDRYGFSAQTFEVNDTDFLIHSDGSLTVELVLRQIDENVFTFEASDDPQAVNIPPVTNLPSATEVENVSGLTLESGTEHLYIRYDGSVFSRLYASWTAPDDAFVTEGGQIEVEFKLYTEFNWQFAGRLSGNATEIYILDVQDSTYYDVRVRSVNSFGVKGDWIEATHEVIGKTEPPADVTNFTGTFTFEGVRFTWNEVTDLDLKDYEIRVGADWDLGTVIGRIDGTSHLHPILTAGTYDFWIKARDTSNNYSDTASNVEIEITTPGEPQSLQIDVINENVAIDWLDAPVTSLPIDHYKIYKGDTFVGAKLLGKASGTFQVHIEALGGSYTYWVTAVDTGGNESTPVSDTVVVFDPANYLLRDDQILLIADTTLTHAVESESNPEAFIAPVNTSESWNDHYINNGWNTPQDQVDAGYPIYLQPSYTGVTATMVKEIDYGAVLPGKIVVTYDENWLDGSGTVKAKIAYKKLSGDPWITVNSSQVLATNFQFLRVTIEVTADDDTSLVEVSNVRVKLDVRYEVDGVTTAVNAGDVDGTEIFFNYDFIDVHTVSGTPQGTEKRKWILDFVDVPDPQSFKVKVWDDDGNRVSGQFRWTAKGIVRVEA